MNSDNQFGKCCKCPARMSDGRIFTNYLPRRVLNQFLMTGNNLNDSHEYRHFFEKNGEKFMESEVKFLEENKRCKF